MPESLDRTPTDQLCALPRHPSSAAAARIVLRGFLSELKDGEHYASDGELIVTELVAAAVLTSQAPEHHLIDVLFEHSAPTGLWIEVTDTGLSGRDRPDSPVSGIVRELSASWGRDLDGGGLWAHLAPPG
ncbi:hypothetical protein F7Q99_04915 [Streptomyces kaniharaensis]|uniref:ATP-binding protein n=1 Tax=Streptomyces kaniharaensis TaxID=212423 RepID=A0A6N7KJP3_9ACTN|nr:hypothetical protein [Streptomyces kaniharaensis]MQS11646.1 hypothetical protein [Streptomyces kaniharaensis]